MKNVRMNTFRKMVKRKRTQPTTNRDDVCTKKPRLRYSTQNESRSPDLKIVRILNRPIKKIQKFFEIISKRNNDPESLESYKKAVQIMERYKLYRITICFLFEIQSFFSGKDISIIGDETIGEKSLFEGPDTI